MVELAGRIDSCTIFSKLDLQKGYFQVPIAAAVVIKTAFITRFSLFKFLHMPLGLKIAGMTFQRLMGKILFDILFVCIYLDYMLVTSRNPEEHQHHIQQVLQRLQHNGLVLNAEKCVWGKPEVEFLGHKILAAGVAPVESCVADVQNFLRPATAAAAIVRPLTVALCGNPASK
jgi:hypothetical protein